MASAAQMTKVTESMQCIWLAVRFHASATEIKKAINEPLIALGMKNATATVWNNPELILQEVVHGGKMKKGNNIWAHAMKTNLAKLMIKYGNKYCVFGTKEVSATKIVEECYRDVPPDKEAEWWTTYIKIADKLFKSTYKKGSGQKFHRGSDWVSYIEGNRYALFNKNASNYFTGVDKWQPADIWMTSTKGEGETLNHYCCKNGISVDATLFEHGNQIMLKMFANRDIIPISLKKIGMTSPVKITEFNTGSKEAAHYNIKFTGATLNKAGDFWKSRDVYVFFRNGGENAIQFRNFASALASWKGELSGTVARGGKIAPEVMERLLDGKIGTNKVGVGIKGTYTLNGKRISKSKFADQNEVRRRILGNTNELKESKLAGPQLTKYKKVVSRQSFKDYIDETYTGKKRLPLTKAGEAFQKSEFIQDFYAYYKLLIGSGEFGMTRDAQADPGQKFMNPEEFVARLAQEATAWIFSKYCGMVMLAILLKEGLTSKNVNALVEQWGLYAFALTPHSCAFIKVY